MLSMSGEILKFCIVAQVFCWVIETCAQGGQQAYQDMGVLAKSCLNKQMGVRLSHFVFGRTVDASPCHSSSQSTMTIVTWE